MEAESLKSPPLTGEFLTASAAWEAPKYCTFLNNNLVSLDWLCCWDPSLVSNTMDMSLRKLQEIGKATMLQSIWSQRAGCDFRD